MNKRLLSALLALVLVVALCGTTLYAGAATITSATNVNAIPAEDNLLAGLTPTNASGNTFATMSDSECAVSALADGIMSNETANRWRGNASSAGLIMVYDLQATATINKFLIGSVDSRYVTGVDIYVGDSLTNLCTADNLAVSVSGISTYFNTFSAADTTFTGQYVAFDFTRTGASWLGNQIRLSELGVYGTRRAAVITSNITTVPEGKNLLTGIAPVNSSGTAFSTTNGTLSLITDGNFTTGEWMSNQGLTDAKMVFDLGNVYALDAFVLGNATSRYAVGVDIYVSTDRNSLFSEDNHIVDASGLANGGKYQFAQSDGSTFTGRYVAFDFSEALANAQWSTGGKMIRLTELGVYGDKLYIASGTTISTVPQGTNLLAGITPINTSGATFGSNVGTTDWLTDGAFITNASTHEGEWRSTAAAADARMVYDLGGYYDLSRYILGNGTSRGALAVDIYVSVDRKNLFNKDNLVVSANGLARGGNYLFGDSDTITGRYVAFDFSYTMTQPEWTGSGSMIRLSELGVYGTAYSPVTNLGGQVRNDSNANNFALRFGFALDCNGVTYADSDPIATNNYTRVIAADAAIMVGDTAVGIADFGVIVSTVQGDSYSLENVDDSYTKIVTATNLYKIEENTVTFTAVVVNIPATRAEAPIYACPYVVTTDGTVLYGEVISRSINQVNADALG